ncbi:MFS transporter [Alkalicoccobacillus porphyridii]|uniref:MFS transporter n=1 Tax=Alkalicoccobacillus porphyridii TaxID=2597270 RepID=A0A554A1T0_9BACI|nr:MFS transporter [Alkalicoccobacillus porphyridii]TSB47644.1 MFS transporter [Alkalicoccobacillus porphyridii]
MKRIKRHRKYRDIPMNKGRQDTRLRLLITANLLASTGMGVLSIGVAWLMVDRDQGEKLLGIAMAATTFMLFFLAPVIGNLIDRVSRKKILQFNQWLVLTVVAPMAVWGLLQGGYETWQLVVLYVTSVLYYGVYFPNNLALVQEIFDRKQHNKLNGILEIQSQTASVIAGGVSGMLFHIIDPAIIFLFVAICSILSLFFIRKIPYQSRNQRQSNPSHSPSDKTAGLSFIKRNVQLSLCVFALTIPFLTLMVGNYLRPVYIQSTLSADASIYGFSNMTYSIGAVAAGVLIPFLYSRYGIWRAVWVSMFVYVASLFVVATVPVVSVFIAVQILQGLGNAGSRICKQNLMMAKIPNAYIGRVNSVFEAVGFAIRLCLLLLFTYLLGWIQVQTAFLATAILSGVGLLIILTWRKSVFRDHQSDVDSFLLTPKSS